MPPLPSGTVTFVFSDVEGSTALLKRLGERYDDVLSAHRRLMRERFTEHGGVEIDTQGDAFFFAFPRARDAVTAAVEAQRAHAEHDWPDGVDVRVRMGLHTGEPALGSEGYLGLDVVRAARLCTAGSGGHVLLSETTRALVGSSLPEGVSIFPLGERRLKDIDEPERVFELEIDGAAPPEEPVQARSTRRRRRPGGGLRQAAGGANPGERQALGPGVAREGAVGRRRARRPGGEASRRDRRAGRARELARTSRTPRSRVWISACARDESSEQSSGRVAGAGALATAAPVISSANSARETASAPATWSGPDTSSSASSSSASARSPAWTGLRISFVKKVKEGSWAASSCFDGSAPP